MSEKSIGDAIEALGLTAPRITPDHIESCITGEYYFTADKAVQACMLQQDDATILTGMQSELRLLTFCVLVLQNGFTATGESACASPENFDAEIGRKIARANAVQKIWPLEGYLLKQRLHETELLRSRPAEECCCHPCLSGEGICNYERGGALFMGGLTSDGTIEPVADSEFRTSAKDSGC